MPDPTTDPVPGGGTTTPPPTTTTTDSWPAVTDPWLDFARKAAADRLKNVKPPAGQESGNGYDAWVLAWFKSGVAAGDADLMKRAGITTKSEGGGEKDLIADWKNAAPSAEWLGKRLPTASELRRYAADKGQSEDYARYPDRVVADWIAKHWQVKEGHFTNDFGDTVEKPTESGPKSTAAGYPTGLKDGGTGGGGNSGSGGTTPTPTNKTNPLSNELLKLWLKDAGLFAPSETPPGDSQQQADQRNKQVAETLPNGALWWGQQHTEAPTPPTADGLPTAGQSVLPGPTAPSDGTAPSGGPPAATPTFFGATASGGSTLPTAPPTPTNPSAPAAPSPASPSAVPKLPNFSQFVLNKGVGNPLMDALMKAATMPRLPT